jgi:phage-related baseplate assembly protein
VYGFPAAGSEPTIAAARPSISTLKLVTARLGKTGDITRAALVLTHFERGYLK